MTARVYPALARLIAARRLLENRYGTGGADAAMAWAAEVAAEARDNRPPPAEVLLAAVTVMQAARVQLDAWELDLIDAARAGGQSWAEVGRAVGYGPGGDTAKQGAAARRRRLAAQRDDGSGNGKVRDGA